MSLVPLIFSDSWDDFGSDLYPDVFYPGLVEPSYPPCRRRRRGPRNAPVQYYRPWGELLRKNEGGGTSTLKADKEKFEVVLDVQQFKPEEINVKVVDKCVVVEGKHEEKQDEHGWISRQFTRRYFIPEQCDLDQVSSSLSSDGVLTITAPRKDTPKVQSERSIKIEHTGKPAIREKQSEDEGKQNQQEEKK